MGRSSFTAVDIAGISLGVLVILAVIGSFAMITRGGLMSPGWRDALSGATWTGRAESGGSAGAEGTDSEQTVYGTFTTVEVTGVAGEIVFTFHDGSGVKVRSVKHAPTQRALDSLRTEIAKEGSRLVVGEKRDDPLNPGSISFYVSLPRETVDLSARTVSGRIQVQGLPAGVKQNLKSVSGRLETDGSGDLSAETVSGSIEFTFAGRDLGLKTISGGVHGTIDSLAPDGRVEADTVSGSVRLAAWEGLAARLNLHSVSGSVSCDFPLAGSMAKHNALEGTVGKGGASLEVGTTSGSIRIEKK